MKQIGVIGAGVMGAGIAAHCANAGAKVVLLDIVAGGAAGAVERMLKTEPQPFMHRRNARLVTPGDLGTDLGKLADCDWIIEAIIERPDAKRALYETLQTVRKPGSIVSSNTSTIPLADLTRDMPAGFAADFLITHFFNPPRYMRLLEVVAGPQTRADAVAAVRGFADHALGKTVIDCKDTPGFIANRIGGLWIAAATRHAFDLALTVEEADAIMGRPLGIPKTGIFGLLDLVGIDLGQHVSASMLTTLPPDDAYRALHRDEPLVARMVAEGRIGRKGKGGFYTLQKIGAERIKQSIDLKTGEYRPTQTPQLGSLGVRDARALVDYDDRGGRYARAVLLDVLSYSAALVPEIADRIDDVDAAMRLGYGWAYGPFELIDRLGAGWLASALRADGRPVPPLLERIGTQPFYRTEDGRLQAFGTDGAYQTVSRPDGVLLLGDIKRAGKPMASNASASLWECGDGVACLEFHSKMNALDPDSMAMIATAVRMGTEGAFKALVIYNEGAQFSVGANLTLAVAAAKSEAWTEIEHSVTAGQATFRALRDAPFPVVGAPSGMALGGGCEVLLHCSAVQAHAETYMGLVEVGVGVIPAWGGCATMLSRWATNQKLPRGPIPPLAKTFEMISTAQVSKSAAEAQDMLLLREGDRITMNRDRLLADARARALELVRDYAPPVPITLRLPGPTGAAALHLAVDGFAQLGRATPHDVTVCTALATTLCGGTADITEETPADRLYDLERISFMALIKSAATQARIEHMLATGKPLRN